MRLETRSVSPDALLLDPNNYRFHDLAGYKTVSRSRYAEAGVQQRALQFLTDTPNFHLDALRQSIMSNGFVPFEQIAVEAYRDSAGVDRFLVIEGNRRAAALKTILKDYEGGGVDLKPEIISTIKNITVAEIIGTPIERDRYQKTLMAIRHVAGTEEWGPYQQARLVVEMYDGESGSFTSVAQRIGISAREVARRYRASKALEQMEKDEEFGEYAQPKLYAFFHEAVSQPKVREWLKFSDVTYKAENSDARRIFYELLSPRENEDGALPPKLQNANRQVRQLKDIVDKPYPLKILSDPEKPFEDAVKAAEAEAPQFDAGILEYSIGIAIQALRDPSIDAWISPEKSAKALWEELVSLVDKIRPMMK